MWPRSPKPLLLLISFFIQVIPSTSNTEIINLSPSLGPRTPAFDAISSNWPVLTPLDGKNERRWTMSHIPREGDAGGCMEKGEWCEDDLWLVLECDAEEWKRHRGFTLRISWPASHPFDFKLEAYTAQDYALKAGLETTRPADILSDHPISRNMYARIRPINIGVLAPWAQRAIAHNQTRSQAMRDYGKVEFITILEPLRFGGIPETLLPTIAFLVPLILVAGFVVFPRVHAYVAKIAREAQEELEGKRL